MNKRIDKYSNKIIEELKFIFEHAPRDDIDWALVMYLFENAKYPYESYLFEEKNVITVEKVAKWFDLTHDETYKRLRRMMMWVSVGSIYGYRKMFDVCNITKVGIDSMMKMIELFDFKDIRKGVK